ncbi:MAG: hypothetical protein ACLP59_31470 [Bryobacteraceae bacterium]
MLKKIGVPVIALIGMLAMAPHSASAAVRFGVVVGAPAYPVYPVCRPAPVVVAPRVVVGPVFGWHRDFRFRR